MAVRAEVHDPQASSGPAVDAVVLLDVDGVVLVVERLEELQSMEESFFRALSRGRALWAGVAIWGSEPDSDRLELGDLLSRKLLGAKRLDFTNPGECVPTKTDPSSSTDFQRGRFTRRINPVLSTQHCRQ